MSYFHEQLMGVEDAAALKAFAAQIRNELHAPVDLHRQMLLVADRLHRGSSHVDQGGQQSTKPAAGQAARVRAIAARFYAWRIAPAIADAEALEAEARGETPPHRAETRTASNRTQGGA